MDFKRAVCTFILVILHALHISRGDLTLDGNGAYRGLLIYVENDVAYTEDFLENLKAIIGEFSQALYTATEYNNGVKLGSARYIYDVTVVVPPSWTEAHCGVALDEIKEQAQILVEKDGDGPPLLRTGMYHTQCGEAHEGPIYMPESFVKDLDGAVDTHGSIGIALTHEFAHLRYGLFDESTFREGANNCWVDDNGDFHAVGCSQEVKGPTKKDPHNNKTCIFKHYPSSRNAKGSIMFYGLRFPKNVDTFCDEEFDGHNPRDAVKHRPDVSHKHNDHCDRRSAWQVLRQHPDFAESLGVGHTPGDLHFRCVRQQSSLRIVLVMDISGSMNTNNRLGRMQQDVESFLRNLYSNGTSTDVEVGMVEFGTNATELIGMTKLETEDDLKRLIDSIPKRTDGRTCIGCGINKALQMLSRVQNGTYGAKIYVFTDGAENEPPKIEDVRDSVLNAKSAVYGLLMDAIADDHPLIKLAEDSGGDFCIYTDDQDGQDYYKCLNDIHGKFSDNLPLEIKREDHAVPGMGSSDGDVVADSTFQKHIRFTLNMASTSLRVNEEALKKSNPRDYELIISRMYSKMQQTAQATACDNVVLIVTSPDGRTIGPTHPGYEKNDNFKSITVTSTEHSPGRWNYTIRNDGTLPCDTKLRVEGFAASDPGASPALRLTTRLSVASIDFNDGMSPAKMKISIYATLKKGASAVVSADVLATISHAGKNWTLRLLDNGAGADLTKDDGTYSSSFSRFDGDGAYNVRVHARSVVGLTVLLHESVELIEEGEGDDMSISLVKNVTRETAEPFERTEMAGTVDVINVPGDIDAVLPPGKITDLLVAKNVWGDVVTVAWTATGANLDDGQASRYDMRISSSHYQLLDNFTSCLAITDFHLVNGTLLEPRPSGQSEQVTIDQQLFNETLLNGTYYLGIVAVDQHNNTGPLSKMVDLHLMPPPPPPAPEPTPGPTTAPSAPMGVYIASAIGVIVLVTALVAAIGVRHRRHVRP